MGCDIHVVLEKRVTMPDGSEKWVCTDTFRGHHSAFKKDPFTLSNYSFPVAEIRNYARFAALAGVRGDGPDPRGLPDDASETTQYLADGDDWHSHSWLPVSEAAEIYKQTSPESLGNFDAADYFFNVYEDEIDQHRIVFWFDN